MRAKELLTWIDTGGYNRVLQTQRIAPKDGTETHFVRRFCDVCGAKATADAGFCQVCGARLPDLR